ncbi:integrase, catalytic region, zinc finger, CCHC-type containing protein [Tanacetum coccineum]
MKIVNTKFDKSETLGKLLCVTPLNTNTAVKAKKVSNTEVKADRSKPVTSHSTPKNEQSQKQSANVIARRIYRITKTETHTSVTRTNISVSNSTIVESSNSVKRSKSKDTKSKNTVLKNTKVKSPSTNARMMSSSVSIGSNKRETMNSTVCQSKANVLKAKTVNAIKMVRILVKRALFTSPLAAKSRNLGDTSVVAKSRNFIEKLWEQFGNDHFATITGCGEQFCNGDLEVAFHSNTCYVQNLKGEYLLTGSRNSNLYTISISEMVASSPVCLMSKATSTKSWLWHRRLSHLNFGTINHLTKKYLVDGLPKFKYDKNHLCSACEQGKSKKASFPPKLVPSTKFKLKLLHMDLYEPIRVASINGKRYILVIVDDYSRYTCVFFLYTKDEAPDMIINFITPIQRSLQAQVLKVRSDNETEFKNEKLWKFYAKSLCYPTNDHDDLGKMKPKADIGPGFNCSNFLDSLEYSQLVPSKKELDNLFGLFYEEYYATSTPEVSEDSAANTLDNKDTPSSSLIIVEENEAPQITTSLMCEIMLVYCLFCHL